MKKKVMLILSSLVFALFIMSGGYGLWSETLEIIMDIKVLPDPDKVGKFKGELMESLTFKPQGEEEDSNDTIAPVSQQETDLTNAEGNGEIVEEANNVEKTQDNLEPEELQDTIDDSSGSLSNE
ncbi:MAG: hypothetical protein GX080_03140 [Tissierellia bacterium]|nr:hypothetical protein [Tissierellia bacterium]